MHRWTFGTYQAYPSPRSLILLARHPGKNKKRVPWVSTRIVHKHLSGQKKNHDSQRHGRILSSFSAWASGNFSTFWGDFLTELHSNYQRRRRGVAKPGGRGRGVSTGGWVFPRATGIPQPPPHSGCGRDLEVRGGGPRYSGKVFLRSWGGAAHGIPVVLGGGGSRGIPVVGRGGGGVVAFPWLGAALPVGLPRPRPPGLAAPFVSVEIHWTPGETKTIDWRKKLKFQISVPCRGRLGWLLDPQNKY